MSNLQPQTTGTRTKINEPTSVPCNPAEAPPPQETAVQHYNKSTKNTSYSTESSNLFKSTEQTSTYHVLNLSSTDFHGTVPNHPRVCWTLCKKQACWDLRMVRLMALTPISRILNHHHCSPSRKSNLKNPIAPYTVIKCTKTGEK